MTLGLRLLLYVSGLIVALVVLAGVSWAALWGMNQKLASALADYERLRWCYETGVLVVRAREAAMQEALPDYVIEDRLLAAVLALDRPTQPAPDERLRDKTRDHLARAASSWRNRDEPRRRQLALHELHAALNAISGASQSIRQEIQSLEREAIVAQRRAQWAVGSLAAVLLVAAVVMGWRHYRAVMRPVRQLRSTSRRLADGQWQERVQPCGDRELADMARDFNRMADHLESLYRDLEDKVRTRSEQLVRAERLATVGVLAAGVAHEINNPLAIIAGQAELALARSPGHRLNEADQEESLRLILDEALRCKAITHKLLSLARPTPSCRRRIELHRVVVKAIDAMTGLATRKGCRLVVRESPVEAIQVEADDMEIRQVLVNLLLNATEAVSEGTGLVEVTIGCDEREAWIDVSDNGAGMDAETLDHVFEPFFTRRHASRPGQGLGLAVSHAIVTSHGGSLSAQSGGPGRGSRFTLRLPRCAVSQEVVA